MEEPRYCGYSLGEAESQMADEITEPKKAHGTSLNKKGNTFQQVGLSIGIGNRLATVWEKFRRTFDCVLKMLCEYVDMKDYMESLQNQVTIEGPGAP